MRFPRRLLPVLGAVGVGILGAWVAVLVAGRVEYQVGPFDVEYFARPGRPGTEIVLPPFGRIVADTHFSPLHLSVTLQSVDPERVEAAARERGVPEIVSEVRADALSALRSYLPLAIGIAILGSLVAGLLVYRRALGRVGIATLAGGLATTLVMGLAAVRFERDAFLEPTYTGSLRLAEDLVGPVRQAGVRLQEFRAELDRIVRASLEAYGGIRSQPTPTAGGIRVLRVSDIHGSPIGMDFALQLARAFDVDLVVDTGDITSFGTPPERAVLDRIDEFGVPYVFVRGNHDSPGIAASMREIENVIVLENTGRVVEGLLIFGAPHPLFTPEPTFDLSDEAIEEQVVAAGGELAADVAEQPRPPDIVALHDDRMAVTLEGNVPLVVSGHFHEAAEAVHGGTIFLRAGTTGGGGIDTFADLEEVPLSAQILYFEGSPPSLVAYDEVAVDPETRDFEVDRRLAPVAEIAPD